VEKKPSYDVVIVGAGIGGLCAGALLAHKGYKTLVVEKRSRIGGRWSTEEYQGFKLPTGAVVIHKGGVIESIFKEVGTKLDNVPLRTWWRLEGKDYEIPPKGSPIAMLLDIVNKLDVERARLVGGIVKQVAVEKIKSSFGKAVSEPQKHAMFTFRDWLLQYTDNEMAHQVFDLMAIGPMNAHSWEISASEMFAFFAKMGGLFDIGIAPEGNIANAEKLAKVIKSNGALWTDCPAKHIVVEKGAARGIVVQKDGSEVRIDAKVVISNVGPKGTVALAGEEHFGEEYLKTMRMRLRPVPVVLILLASDRPLWGEAGDNSSLIGMVGTRRMMGVFPLSNPCPGLAPPGQHLFYSCACPQSSLLRMDVEEEFRQCALDIKEQFPEFEKHGRILKLEAHNIDDEFPELRTWPGYDMPRETPVRNLFNAGDGVKSSGMTGTGAAAETAQRVVDLVKKAIKPGAA
jgi:phytoene dehydrogenase-like protein